MSEPLIVLQTWVPSETETAFIAAHWPAVDIVPMAGLSDKELNGVLPEVDAIMGYTRTFPKGCLARAPRVRMVHVLGHGVDGLLTRQDVEEVRRRGIVVARSNPAAVCIAEFVMMAMVVLSRRVVVQHNSLALRGDWSTELWARRGEGLIGGELSGESVGILGFGGIGEELSTRASSFGMTVGAVTRDVERLKDAKLGFVSTWDGLPAFLQRCKFVVLTLPLTQTTRHVIGRDELAMMRSGSFLVNVGRGPLVDEEALWEALNSGHLAGAALDVFESEEVNGRNLYPTRRPLHHFNTLLTPHIAGATAEARERALAVMGDNLRQLAAGLPIKNAARMEEFD